MEKDIGKIQKNDITDIVVRIDDFGGKAGVTIREYMTGDRYTGFTKAGTRIPVDKFEEFKKIINSIEQEDLEEAEKSAEEKADKETQQEQQPTNEDGQIEGQETL